MKNSQKAPKAQSSNEEAVRTRRELALDKTLADSFPASDPPSSIPNPEDEYDIASEEDIAA